MAEKSPTDQAAGAAPKSKKMLVIGLILLLLGMAAGGGVMFIKKRNAALADAGEEVVVQHEPKAPPVYLPLDNMVVNLADPGGERVAQVGVVLELSDAHAPDKVKPYLPAIRSGMLLLISQRTAEELLQREGKEKLASDILGEAARHFQGTVATHGDRKSGEKKSTPSAEDANPVQGVLFSSFIVQ